MIAIVVGIIMSYSVVKLLWPNGRVLILGRSGVISLCHHIQVCSKALLASSLTPEVKRPEHEDIYSPPSDAKV
jgi:hypothetical protein